ncbi:uncharacterized protein LOC111270744 isoform X2 [Varroa jacobsoni]|uniref:uncharacterized protein LOC111270744 isoform X2 n=1 Tax=Varroa jacobsoni TaxID=62625 RepID=UPI000BF3E323|nr:uncharacterized protein LOC111270744 isoform X2 [Varroa jacobsoni]
MRSTELLQTADSSLNDNSLKSRDAAFKWRLFLWAHFMEVCVKNCQPSCNFSSGLWASCLDACKWRCLKARMLARQRLCATLAGPRSKFSPQSFTC